MAWALGAAQVYPAWSFAIAWMRHIGRTFALGPVGPPNNSVVAFPDFPLHMYVPYWVRLPVERRKLMKTPADNDELAADELLMDQMALTPDDALRELYIRHGEVLCGVAMRVLHDETDTEEVLQDVFVHLWQKPERFMAERGSVLAWLITLTRRRAIDRVRQRMAYRRATDRLEVQSRHRRPVGDECHPVERMAEQDDLHDYLAAVISHLPPAQRDVIEWTFFEGMSQRQIADSRHLPLGTVKTRIELGLRRLAGMMLKAKVA